MPVLARFYGFVIRMYFPQSEHKPPRIHAIYGEDTAAIDIRTGAVIEGELPPRALSLVAEWIALHRTELSDIWERREFRKIAPLE